VTARPLRSRLLAEPRRLGCGCKGQAGDTVYQAARGKPWMCTAHCQARLRDYPPRHGAATVDDVLADTRRRP
jgi:hypothetical protein